MATGQTPTYLLPYPLSTDPVDVHGDIFELADRLEDIIGGLSGLPSQSGNNGKYLTTDGSAASWATISLYSAPTIGSTVIGSGATVTTIAGLTLTSPTLTTPALGTPSSGTLTNATGLPISGLVSSTTTALGVGSINLGHASDTQLTRNSAGILAVNGFVIPSVSSNDTLTSKTLSGPREVINTSATAATGTVQFDTTGACVMYYTSNASGNWTLNVRGNSGLTLNSYVSAGTSITITFLVTNGTTAYYPTSLTIDGTTQTVRWQGGTAPTSGNASSIDAYVYTILKTAANTYTVLGSQTKFA